MVVQADDLTAQVRIEDPEFYSDDPFPVFARMRQEAPTFWYEPLRTWVLTKYDDIRLVGRTPEIFSSADGILLNDIRYGNAVASFFGENAEVISLTDPPRHRELRRYLAPSFTPSSIKEMEPTVRELCRTLIAQIEPGEPINFVEKIGAVLPLQVIAILVGIPGDNIAQLKFWSDETLKMGAALDEEGLRIAAANSGQMKAYLDEWMVRRLGDEGRELIPTLLNARVRGENLSYDNLHMFIRAILVAGNETTRDYLTGSLWTYALQPEQRAKLVADPSLSAQAGEECLRWVTPVRGFIRTIVHDTEIRGQEMKTGEHVQLMWMAANRDEDIWADADTFDIERKPDPMHIAFGFGEHACLGAAVARLEGRVFFEELVQSYSHWELAGEPTRPHSVMHNSFEELPVVFHR